MPSCSHCSGNRPISTDEQLINSPDGTRKKRRRLFTSCSACGRVLRDRSLRSLDKALAAIQDIATNALHLNPNTADSIIISDAQDLVRKAMAKEEELFRLGRHTRTHVAAACLYISLRRHRKPYMLIDLSDYLRVTVYVVGAMFVALCRILRIKEDFKEEEEEEVEDLYSNSSSSSCFVIDPSLFMHRISTRLLGRKDAEVASMALRILSRTNQKQRGWMLTKQKQIPVRRICTAALYIAAATACAEEEDDGRVHKFSKLDVARAVRSEFKSMESGDELTMDEFVSRAAGMTTSSDGGGGGGGELVCQHKKSSRPHCRYGLCKECYHVFVTVAGDIWEHSAEPPPSRPTARMNKIRREGEVVKALESLSDVEDYDISEYLNTETEKLYKTVIWELMNKEYLEEKKSNDAAAAAATGNKPKKERKNQRRVGDNTLSEEMLPEKRVSSRINYDVLAQLNGEAKQQLETDVGVVVSEENNEGYFDIVEEAREEDQNEAEGEIDGDGKSAAAEGDDYYGDFEEDYGEGGYNEYCDDDFAGDDDDDDFRF